MNKLPDNYADKVMQCEVILEANPDMQNLKALNELYGIGISHYIDIEPLKARHLQKKMAALLSRPNILEILQEDAGQVPDQSDTIKKAQSLNKKLKTEVVKFHSEADNQIKQIMQKSKQAYSRVTRLRDNDINRQQSNLNTRLLSRAKSSEKLKKFKSCKLIRTQRDEED